MSFCIISFLFLFRERKRKERKLFEGELNNKISQITHTKISVLLSQHPSFIPPQLHSFTLVEIIIFFFLFSFSFLFFLFFPSFLPSFLPFTTLPSFSPQNTSKQPQQPPQNKVLNYNNYPDEEIWRKNKSPPLLPPLPPPPPLSLLLTLTKSFFVLLYLSCTPIPLLVSSPTKRMMRVVLCFGFQLGRGRGRKGTGRGGGG